MNNKILNLLLVFSLTSLLLVPAANSEPGTGRISGKLIIEGDDTIMSKGEVYFYNSATGPPPAWGKYLRYPNAVSLIKAKGLFSVEIPEGEYYIEAIIRTSGSNMGPPMEGDHYYLSSDKEGRPRTHVVESGKSVDLGIISSAAVYQKSAVEEKITGIKGTVIDADGKPAEGIVVFTSVGETEISFASEMTGVDGKYSLGFDQGGEYKISVMDIRGERPPIHAISINDYVTGVVTIKTDEIIENIDIKLVYAGTSGKH